MLVTMPTTDRIQKRVLKFMADNYPPNFTYQDFASDFK